jgi:hypothetical protein
MKLRFMLFPYLLSIRGAFWGCVVAFLSAHGQIQIEASEISSSPTDMHPAQICNLALRNPKESNGKLILTIRNNSRNAIPFFINPNSDVRFSMVVRGQDNLGKEVSYSSRKEFSPSDMKKTDLKLESLAKVEDFLILDIDSQFGQFLKKNQHIFDTKGISAILLRVEMSHIYFPPDQRIASFTEEDLIRAVFYSPWITLDLDGIQKHLKEVK